jgi:hypothetical protein
VTFTLLYIRISSYFIAYIYLKIFGQLLIFKYNFFRDYLVLEDEGTTTALLNVRTLLIQRDTVTFPDTRIFTHNNQQFGVIFSRSYLAYGNALLPLRPAASDLSVLVLDYTELYFQRETHMAIRTFNSLRHIKHGNDFHHTKIFDASTF